MNVFDSANEKPLDYQAAAKPKATEILNASDFRRDPALRPGNRLCRRSCAPVAAEPLNGKLAPTKKKGDRSRPVSAERAGEPLELAH